MWLGSCLSYMMPGLVPGLIFLPPIPGRPSTLKRSNQWTGLFVKLRMHWGTDSIPALRPEEEDHEFKAIHSCRVRLCFRNEKQWFGARRDYESVLPSIFLSSFGHIASPLFVISCPNVTVLGVQVTHGRKHSYCTLEMHYIAKCCKVVTDKTCSRRGERV